jgi:hypothetical protein
MEPPLRFVPPIGRRPIIQGVGGNQGLLHSTQHNDVEIDFDAMDMLLLLAANGPQMPSREAAKTQQHRRNWISMSRRASRGHLGGGSL